MNEQTAKPGWRIPSLPSFHVARPRLDRLWDAWENRRLRLVTAGAGFGKTSFLAAQARRGSRPVIWCSLDELDADPANLLARLLASMRGSDPGAQDPDGGEGKAHPEGVLLKRFLKKVHGSGAGVVIFDDVQVIAESAEALRLLDRIVALLPEGCSVVLSSRGPVAVQTARLQSLGAVGIAGAAELRFTEEELASFLRARFLGSDPEPALVRRLLDETEGWAAGIEIFVQASGGSIWAIWEALERSTSTGRGWFAYFAEEVLGSLDPATQDFLRRSSVLPRLDAGLCDRVLSTRGSAEKLQVLCARNLFTFPLDSDAGLYRYHHLFREFLLDQLERRTDPGELRALRIRCANALADAGAWAEAAMAYAEGGDPQATLEVVERLGERLLATGHYRILRRAIESIPEEMLSRRPLALSLLGRLREIHGEWEAASRTYNEALGLLPRGGRRAELLSLLAQAHIRRGEYGAGERTCVETLGQPGRKPARLRGRILCLLGVSAGELGRLDEAEKRFREAIRIFRRVGDAAEEARALSLMAANVLFYRGDYRRAKDLGRQALVIFQRLRDQRRICHTMMGIGLHAAAAGEEREARDLAERALRIAESLEYRMAEGYCHHALGRCALLSRNPEGARRHFERARRLGEQLGEQSLLTWPRLGCAEAHLLEGNRRGARTIAEEILGRTRRGKSPYMEGRAYTILGLSEPRSSPREAANWWRRAERIFREIGALYRLHEILLLRLAAGDVSRRKEPEKIQELLAGCASLDHRFLLTDHGADHAAAVLPRAILLDVETDFAAGVLAAIGERAVPHVEAAIARADERARMRCIEVLARIGGRRAHRVLECAGRSGSAAGRAARDAARDLDAAPAVPLRVHALGSCHVWIGDVLIERDRWRSARAARLFQFLLVQRARWVPRDVLIEALWPGADPSRAENNLRQSIHLLRKTLEPELVETRHSRYVLFRGEACKLDLGEGGQSDIESFERLIREADRRLDEGRHRKAERALREAIDLYKGDLLEESPYEEFLAAAREDLRDRHLRALEKLVRLLDANRRHEEIVPICRRGLSRDPYSEDFAWHLIHALLRLGNRREAIEAYHRYEKLLVQELDVLPSQRMKALAAQATALRPGSRRGAASEARSQSPRGALLDGNGLADR